MSRRPDDGEADRVIRDDTDDDTLWTESGEALDDSLDRGLRVAFGALDDASLFGLGDPESAASSKPLAPTQSPLDTLDRRAGVRRLDRYVDARRGDSTETGLTAGRYRLGDELGRGGVGQVFLANDVDLGRELALKVLLDDHVDNPAMTRRFIEEAQVAGQLQHPGVVPVHQLGTLDDGRIFFAMKLVRGKTLAELLAERDDVAAERQHYLGIFHMVCQTMAYAHARGVVHRDLKPENIMVGSFGEVQVVDWGLAKILDRAETGRDDSEPSIETLRSTLPAARSMVGSVMGTPSYMSPEQARGEIDRLDERTDVFGLGAILCEIIAGRPPYEGKTSIEVRDRAARGDILTALADIDACGADAEVRAIARHCLAFDPANRPRDAGEVGAEIGLYLESLEARAHASQLDAAEARGAARQERRARRLTMIVALLLFLSTVGAALYVVDRNRRQHRSEIAVRDALSRSEQLAATGGPYDRDALARALDAADHAVDVAERSPVSAVTLDAARGRQSALTEAVERAHWVARLRAVRDDHGDDPNWQHKAPGYRGLFAEYGIDFDRDAEDTIVTRLRESGLAEPFAVALDDWARFLRREAGAAVDPSPTERDAWQVRLRVARRIDDDPARSSLRAAFEREDIIGLRGIASTTPPTSPYEVVLLGASLIDLGDIALARQVFARGRIDFPGDYWVAHGSGVCELCESPPRFAAALPHLNAALALRPTSAHSWSELAMLYENLDRPDLANEYYRRAIELQPDFDRAKIGWARLLIAQAASGAEADQDGLDHARALYRRATHGRHARLAFTELAALERQAKDFPAASEALRHALAWDADDPEAIAEQARLAAAQGDDDAAVERIQRALEFEPKSAMYWNDLAAFEWKRGHLERAIESIERAIACDPKFSLARRSLGELRHAEGKNALARSALEQAIEVEPSSARAWYKLGIVEQLCGDDHWLASLDRALELGARGELDEQARVAAFSLLHAAAKIAFRRGDMAEAAPLFRVIRRVEPSEDLPVSALRTIRYNGAIALQAVGDYDAAAAEFAWVLAVHARHDELRAFTMLGRAKCLQAVGRFAEARDAFAGGVELCREVGSERLGEAEHWLATAERIVALAPDCDRWLAEVSGDARFEAEAKTAASEHRDDDVLALGYLAADRQRWLAALSAYDAWLDAKRPADSADAATENESPERLRNVRLLAAQACLRASRDPQRLGGEARALRERARQYLSRHLAAMTDVDPRRKRVELGHWLIDDAMATVRDQRALAELPSDERALWLALWSEYQRVYP